MYLHHGTIWYGRRCSAKNCNRLDGSHQHLSHQLLHAICNRLKYSLSNCKMVKYLQYDETVSLINLSYSSLFIAYKDLFGISAVTDGHANFRSCKILVIKSNTQEP